MSNVNSLHNMNREKEFLLCIDSDGCAIDSMEVKHKKVFGPKLVKVWDLGDIEEDVIEVWNFVNLYSSWRGLNRFAALVKVFELLGNKAGVKKKGFILPDFTHLEQWVKNAAQLSHASLETEIKLKGSESLKKALAWSTAVNKSVTESHFHMGIFDYVKESLMEACEFADIVVISSEHREALTKEWTGFGIAQYVKVMAGQDFGKKKDCIGYAKSDYYENHKTIMLGDSSGDLAAAKGNGILFYPIIPGSEALSWKNFYETAFHKFLKGLYEGAYESSLINEFENKLTSILPWDTV